MKVYHNQVHLKVKIDTTSDKRNGDQSKIHSLRCLRNIIYTCDIYLSPLMNVTSF
jgi:hypothetical protein